MPPRVTTAELDRRVLSLEEARLTDQELRTMRQMLRTEQARLQRRANWIGPRELWQRWTAWRRLGAILAAIVLLATAINQLGSLYLKVETVTPHLHP